MTVIPSQIKTGSADFRRNRQHYHQLIEGLHAKRQAARRGGTQKAKDRHEAAGKLLPRDRVDALLDPGSPFLELAELAGDGLNEGVPPGAGIVTGIGLVRGRACMIIANDATVKGGTYLTMTAKKHVRAQTIAWENRLPNITLVDSGGANLPEQAGIFPDQGQFGSIFYQIVRQSAENIPQIAVVHGACTAGGAYVPALCDQAVIIRGQGSMYLGGPELTFSATGEVVDRESLGGAEMHSRVSGVTDHLAEDDRHALGMVRELVGDLPPRPALTRPVQAPAPPRYDPQEIYGIVSSNPRVPTDTREILARLVDDSRFAEFKANYGETLLCGFAHINGYQVGILANQGVLFVESSLKAVHFIDLCCKRDIPLLFLADVTGFMVGREAERHGIAKAGAKMITAMASANVPRYKIMIGNSYGAGYMSMCARPFRPRMVFGWPNAKSALMGPDQAATTLAMVQRQKREREGLTWSEQEEEDFRQPVYKQFLEFSNMNNYAAQLWIDNIIDPVETRPVMGLLLDLAARIPGEETRFGVLRM
ncbi:MAG: carboxyl transferase domain-containing protein [bacterium]